MIAKTESGPKNDHSRHTFASTKPLSVKVYYKAGELLRMRERAKKAGFSSVSLYLKRCEAQNEHLDTIEAFKRFKSALHELLARLE